MSDDAVRAAADELYALPAEEFVARRDELARAAKAGGDAARAKAIGRLRKPTAPAAVVNRYALGEPDEVARLGELGDRLRRAHRDLSAVELRDLTAERRRLVAELADAALAHSDRSDPTTALRDEVVSTLDAAVADPDVAAQLGRLLKPAHFSGFGIAPGPELTLVTGGSGRGRSSRANAGRRTAKPTAKPTERPTARPTDQPPEQPSTTSAARRLARTLARARDAFAAAEEQQASADAAEQRAKEQVSSLTAELAELQKDLDTAKRGLDTARRDARAARVARREARSALDRAERKAAQEAEQ